MRAKAAMQDARSDATILNPRDRQVTFISLSVSVEAHSAQNRLSGSHDGTCAWVTVITDKDDSVLARVK